MISSRERVRLALNHEETGRPPQDLGTSCNTSITKIAYCNLLEYLGLPIESEPPFLSQDMQVVEIEDSLLERLHIDTRGLHANPPDNDRSEVLSDQSYRDEWGISFRAATVEGKLLYYDVEGYPLSSITSVEEIERYLWPDPLDPGRTRGLKDKARRMRAETKFAIFGHMGDTSIFQACTLLRGMEQFLIDLVTERPLVQALMEKVLEIQSIKMARFLDEVGEHIDVVGIGDDFAGQSGPLISPDLFRTMVKPYLKRYCDIIKSKTDAPIHLHSCGAVMDLLPDFIELGIEIINPVQVSARGMDPAVLKEKYGKDLCFWGGIDTQNVLPYGTPEEVKEEVARISGVFGKNGGYVLNPVHNLQPDVPPENIVAMYETFFDE
ncbi:MAG TPA: uroporphyrinogen decarboxylase family protein [Spirochaetota bacterium]|nr:uroporphyrinogen decarboxylase family protein [Spirochaetota bacterium]